MRRYFVGTMALATFGAVQTVYAQYPQIPKKVQEETKEMMDRAMQHSDSAWQAAWPTIQREEREGKPYAPWAARPTDLPQADIPAFPGAEGGGKYSFGGRGGKVYVVTSLADSGPGSLREACEKGGARTIVFNVAGIIHLKTPLIIRAPYITIAGQTAPGNGVCVAGESVWINTHDVVIRFMRFRRGETNVGRRDDAIGGNPIGNIMIDHVSASWGLDENMSMYRHMYDDGTGKKLDEKLGTVNITIQNSIFSEGLDTWNHAFGSTLGGENCTFMRNLWADNTGRNPSIGWNGIFNFANNVVFNWVHRSVDGGDYKALYNIINNYYKPGPSTQDGPVGYRILKPESGRSKLSYVVFGRAYVNGNIMHGNERVTKDNWDGGVQMEGKDGNEMSLAEAKKDYFPYMKVNKPFPMAPITILSAEDAYQYVLANVGATLPERDPVDTRVIKQVRTGQITDYNTSFVADTMHQFKYRRLPKDSYKKGIITDVREVGGYPDYQGKPYKDSDSDGMPDSYEKKQGLNPHSASDASLPAKNGNGYTNIEVYLNSVVDINKVRPKS